MSNVPDSTPTRKARNKRERESTLSDLDARVTRLAGVVDEDRQSLYELLKTVQALQAAQKASP